MSKYWVRADHRLRLTDVSPTVHEVFGSEPGHLMATAPRLPWAAARAYLQTVQQVLDTGQPAACVIEPREGHPGWLYCWPVLGGVVASFSPFEVPEVVADHGPSAPDSVAAARRGAPAARKGPRQTP